MRHRLPSLLLILAACAPIAARPPLPAQTGDSARYVCADGREIEVLYGGGVAVVQIGRTSAEMRRAPAADGERYVGGGWQWWAKGKRNGSLASLPAGQDVAPGGTACRAP